HRLALGLAARGGDPGPPPFAFHDRGPRGLLGGGWGPVSRGCGEEGGGGAVGRAVVWGGGVFFSGPRGLSRPRGGTGGGCAGRAAGCTRFDTPSLRRMLVTWTPAVLGLMYSSAPICALVRPVTSRRSTTSSRSVSP